MVFLGGAVLGELMKDRKEGFWMTREAYQEHGTRVLDMMGPSGA